MRTSILSRSVVAVATLAIGSVALGAVPANAATPNGVTRDQVLTAASGVRAADASKTAVSAATARALRAIVYKTCDVLDDNSEGAYVSSVRAMSAGGAADGLLISARVDRGIGASQECTFAAIATTDASSTLTGGVTVKGTKVEVVNGQADVETPVSQTTALSGDVFTSPIINNAGTSFDNPTLTDASASAAGNVTKTANVTKRVADKKTKSEKAKAKAKYAKKIKSVKKSYAKALDKAGKSKSKKTAAKKAYKTKRAAAKASYKYAIAGYKLVTKKNQVISVQAFSIATPAQQ
ncbi:MAG: hypothetical protein ABWY58_07775 [Aeromicrobium sp.]